MIIEFGGQRGLKMFAEWTTAIKNGAVPETTPPRPAGIERNLVLSMWEWGTPIDYIHDQVTTDKRNPHINANGRVYGINLSHDELTILDPQTHTASSLPIPVRSAPAISVCCVRDTSTSSARGELVEPRAKTARPSTGSGRARVLNHQTHDMSSDCCIL